MASMGGQRGRFADGGQVQPRPAARGHTGPCLQRAATQPGAGGRGTGLVSRVHSGVVTFRCAVIECVAQNVAD